MKVATVTLLGGMNLLQAAADCLVGDIIYTDGQSVGYIGLECINSTSFDGNESTCVGDEIVKTEKKFTCPDSVPYCVQCGPRGWGAALCLSTNTTDRDCGDDVVNNTAAVPVTISAAAPKIDNAPFADTLTKELYAMSDNVNDCTSSLGISMALSLVYPSSIDVAYTEMQTVLGYPMDRLQLVWNETSTRLTNRYQGICHYEYQGKCEQEDPTIEIANSIWVHNEIVLNSTYAAVVGDYVQQLNFTSTDAGSVVNAWVSESTNGLIDSIVDDGPLTPWILLAVNSIYLKASWSNQFLVRHTNVDTFYNGSTTITASITGTTVSGAVQAHFMHQVDFFPYSHDALPGFQLIKLPFSGNADATGLSMVVALPMIDIWNPENMASSRDVLAAIPKLYSERVALALPKFRFESKYEDDLKASLQAMGLVAPFQEETNVLCIPEGRCDAFIDVIIQKTLIDVNELGVEAAAVTAVGASVTSMPDPNAILFQADHPFQFFLYDDKDDVIIFEGRIKGPDLPDNSLAPLSANHTESNFWSANFGSDVTSPVMPSTIAEVTTTPATVTTQTPETTASTTPAESQTINTVIDIFAYCLVDDITYTHGQSAGHIGLECINSTSYYGNASTCVDGEIVETEEQFTCPNSAPYCVQCGTGWGAALCLSTNTTGRDCGDDDDNNTTDVPVTISAAAPMPQIYCLSTIFTFLVALSSYYA